MFHETSQSPIFRRKRLKRKKRRHQNIDSRCFVKGSFNPPLNGTTAPSVDHSTYKLPPQVTKLEGSP